MSYDALNPHPSCKVYPEPRPRVAGLTEGQRKAATKFNPQGPGVLRMSRKGQAESLGLYSTIQVTRAAGPIVETRRSPTMRGETSPVRPGSRRGRGRKMNLHESNLAHRMGCMVSATVQIRQAHEAKAAKDEADWITKRLAAITKARGQHWADLVQGLLKRHPESCPLYLRRQLDKLKASAVAH